MARIRSNFQLPIISTKRSQSENPARNSEKNLTKQQNYNKWYIKPSDRFKNKDETGKIK